jgi:hypothetical protein
MKNQGFTKSASVDENSSRLGGDIKRELRLRSTSLAGVLLSFVSVLILVGAGQNRPAAKDHINNLAKQHIDHIQTLASNHIKDHINNKNHIEKHI